MCPSLLLSLPLRAEERSNMIDLKSKSPLKDLKIIKNNISF